MRIQLAAIILLAPLAAKAQDCPQPPPSLPPVIAETSAWCPACAHDALDVLSATIGDAAGMQDAVDRESHTILNMVRAEETGSSSPDYGALTFDSGGLTYGAYQFDSHSGELRSVLQLYASRSDSALAAAMQPYINGMAHGHSYNTKAFRSLLKQAASDPVMQQAQDDYYLSQHLQPSMQQAADLGLRSPLGVALYADIQTNGGIASVIKTAKRRVPSIKTPGDEARFIQAMLDARESRYRYLASRGMGRYLNGWLARNNDFRKAFANNGIGLEDRISLPHIGTSFCGTTHGDARAFGLYMAALADNRPTEVAVRSDVSPDSSEM